MVLFAFNWRLKFSLYIIIFSYHHHRYPWPSLATPYHSTVLAGLQGYMPYPHRAAVCRFELVTLLLHGHMRRSIGEHWRCPWCNSYRRGKWTQRHEFKSWTRLITFHIAQIPLGKVWIQLFSLQIWVNSRTD